MQKPAKTNLGGRPVEISERLILLDVAISGGGLRPRREGVGIRQAQKLIRQNGADALLGKDRVIHLQELGESDDAQAFLKIQETIYLGKRYELGFNE
jgi:hypothetical protein